MTKATFTDLSRVPAAAGLYEIYLRSGRGLKVGTSSNLRRRLGQHARSKQNRLILKPGGNWNRPADVCSKQSILAKHLFFDRTIAPRHNLKNEGDRRGFLRDDCIVCYAPMPLTQAKARESLREKSGKFRYVGRARVR